jgi:betaine reductase
MTKAIEQKGIATVHVCSIVPISLTVGANRIVPAVSIPHPTGNPAVTPNEEKLIRKSLLLKCLKALETEVNDQTVF